MNGSGAPSGLIYVPCAEDDQLEMFRQMLKAARRVNEPTTAVRATHEGFWVPYSVASYLFPTKYPEAS